MLARPLPATRALAAARASHQRAHDERLVRSLLQPCCAPTRARPRGAAPPPFATPAGPCWPRPVASALRAVAPHTALRPGPAPTHTPAKAPSGSMTSGARPINEKKKKEDEKYKYD
jgi:hypothetical protein